MKTEDKTFAEIKAKLELQQEKLQQRIEKTEAVEQKIKLQDSQLDKNLVTKK